MALCVISNKERRDLAQQHARGLGTFEERIASRRQELQSAQQAILRWLWEGVDDAHEAYNPSWSINRGSRQEGLRRVEEHPG